MNRTLTNAASLIALVAMVGCASPKKLKNAYAEIDRLEAEVTALEGLRGEVVRADELERRVAQLQSENADLAATVNNMTSELAGFRVTGDSEFVLFHDRASLQLEQGIFFATGSAELTPTGHDAVAALARVMKQHPGRHFAVEGHTDPRPISTDEHPTNWELGADRALAVVHELIDAGIPETQLSAVTYAATRPAMHTADYSADRRISVAFEMSDAEQLAWARAFGGRDDVVAEADEEVEVDIDEIPVSTTVIVEPGDDDESRRVEPRDAWVAPAEDTFEPAHIP